MMATNVLMPQLGESIAEGTIVRWNKQIGDRVDRDEPLFEVSTDKVDAEVPSPAGGIVADVCALAGETVPVDSVVAIIGAPDEEVVRTGKPPLPAPAGTPAPPEAPRSDATPRGEGRLSPVVRRLASEHGIDPAEVAGTGAGGRVTKGDILRHVRSERPSIPSVPAAAPGLGRVEPLSVMRRQIAEHMLASRRTSAHVHTVFDVDFTRVAALRDAHREPYSRKGARLTYLSFIAKAVVDALADTPIVNASLSGDGAEVRYNSTVNLGIAVALDDGDGGLLVPVIRDAASRSVFELSVAVADLAARARDRRLSPDEVQGGTFTITNPGAAGSIFGMPIINQPQVAILCVGAVERRPVVVGDDGKIEARPRCYLTLGFDHRLIDGAVADRFMAKIKAAIEHFEAGWL